MTNNSDQSFVLSICIVSFNVSKHLKNCLTSIKQNLKNISYEVIVVDNNSKDNTHEMISQNFSDIVFLPQNKNYGFAKANNIAIKRSKSEFIFLLNPDTIIMPGSIEKLIDYLKNNPECGIVGPQLLNDDETIQKGLRQFPTPQVVFIRNSLLKNISQFKKKIDAYHMRHADLSMSFSVDQVSGAAMMMRKSLFDQIGLLDERFFVFFEEVDLCKRTKISNLDVFYNSDSKIYHLGGKSMDHINSKARILHMESQLKYLKKYMNRLYYYIFCILFKMIYLLTLMIECFFDFFSIPFYYFMKNSLPLPKYEKKYSCRIYKLKYRYSFLTQKTWSFLFKM